MYQLFKRADACCLCFGMSAFLTHDLACRPKADAEIGCGADTLMADFTLLPDGWCKTKDL
jgi:hypothetical protein